MDLQVTEVDMLKELKRLPNWVGYKRIQRGDKWTKVPMNPNTGGFAESNNKSTWSTYEDALVKAEQHGWDGVGFMFEPPYIGIDLDHCFKDGVLSNFAVSVLDKCASYSEFSPSGDGLHILVKGTIAKALHTPEIEIYQNGRFFTITQKPYGSMPIRELDFDPSTVWGRPVEEKINRAGWISEALNNLEEGKRHAVFAKLIGRLNRDGFADVDIFTLLSPHAEACGMGKDELLKQVRNMTKLYADQAAKPMSGLTAKQLLSSAKVKIPWLVEGLFPKEGVGILAGHPKIGKSWLTLDLAITVSNGGLWLNKFPVVSGHVLYIDEESSQDMLGSRLLKLLNQKGLTDAKIQFHVKEGFNFSVQQKIDEIRQVMNLFQPKLVIFDSLNRVHKAEENSASQMGEVFRRVSALSKEFSCFILFTDHLPHGQERFRGSTDKEAFVDAGFLATKIGNSNLLLDHKYARHEQVPSFELAILDDGPDKTYIRWIG